MASLYRDRGNPPFLGANFVHRNSADSGPRRVKPNPEIRSFAPESSGGNCGLRWLSVVSPVSISITVALDLAGGRGSALAEAISFFSGRLCGPPPPRLVLGFGARPGCAAGHLRVPTGATTAGPCV